MKYNEFNIENAVSNLKRLVIDKELPIPIFYTILVGNPSSSGMSRVINLFVIIDNEPVVLSVGRVGGIGMDMGFHVSYQVFCDAYPCLRYQDHLKHRWF